MRMSADAETKVCESCHVKAPGSIDDRNGEFYCYACWEEYSHVGHDEPDVMLEMESVDSLKKEGSLHQFVREENHGTPGYNTTGTHLTPCSEGNSQAAVQLEDFSAFEDAITRIESDSASKPAFRRRINSLETAQTEHTAFSGALLHPNHGLRARSEEPGAFDAFSSALSNSPRMRRKNMRESLDKVALSTQHEASMSAQSAATQRHRREKPSGWALYAQNYSLEMISTVSFDTMQRDDGTTTKNIRSKDRGAKSLHNSAVPRQTSLPDVKHGRADAKWQPVEPPRGRRWTLFGGRRRTTTQAETRTMEYASPQPSEWSGAGSPVDSAPKQRFSVRKIIQSSRKRSATITGHT